MSEIISWVAGNVDEIFAVAAAAHVFALAVVNLTPTPKDNEIVGKVYKFVEMAAGVFTRKAKELPGETTGL